MTLRFRHIASVVCCALGLSGQAYAQPYTRVSVRNDGTEANSGASEPVASRNGRYIAFTSMATDLVSGDTNSTTDVFIRDLVAATTTRISVATDGTEHVGQSGSAAINSGFSHLYGPGVSLSDDGSVIAFSTNAQFDPVNDNMSRCTPPVFGFCSDVYVRDRNTNQTTLISVAADGGQAEDQSGDPQISGDGRYVLFTSSARNMIANDQNAVDDVFLRDRVTNTTTRVSVTNGGAELNSASYRGRMSADAQIIVFLTASTNSGFPEPLPCPTGQRCEGAYVLNRGTGDVKRIPIPATAAPDGAAVRHVAITPDGRFVAVLAFGWSTQTNSFENTIVEVYDRQTGRIDVDLTLPGHAVNGNEALAMAINESGRIVSIGPRVIAGNNTLQQPVAFDRLTRSTLPASETNLGGVHNDAPQFSADGLRMLVADQTQLVPADTNGQIDVYLVNRDVDGDGIPGTWETQFGFNPANPADAALDADGDGVTNLQEYLNGTLPNGTFKRYFAEGAANSFFSARFALFNPNDQPATVMVEFLGANSQTRSTPVQLPAHGWSAIELNDTTSEQPDNDFSTVVESTLPVVADRTMTWDKTGYGSHAETSIDSPGTTWYMAEGSTGGTFDLFYLMQNPGATPANVTVTYLLPAPAAPIVKQYTVAPRTRKTIHVDEEDPAVQFTDVSAKVVSDQPILVERAMYFSTPSQPFAAGHEGAAVTAPTTSWFFAEGATGSFFDLFLLLANAETTQASVDVTYLLASGAPITKHYTVDPQSRKTINVDFEDQRLIDTPVSMVVESKNSVPIIAERAMWWPSPNWYEAHLSAGATTTGTKWALAEGLVTNMAGSETETFVLIANTSATAGNADVTLFFGDGTSMTKNFLLPANSRTNVRVLTEFPDAVSKGGYGTVIQSNGVPIVVERAMYTNANGQTWAAGTDALATKLQ